MAKRPYKKRNLEYWNNLSEGKLQNPPPAQPVENVNTDFEPFTFGDPLLDLESNASASRLSNPSGRRKSRSKNLVATGGIRDKYANIDEGLLPFHYSRDCVGVSDAVLLCQKAYFNIAVFRSTIDLLSEFADAELHLKGGNASSRKFINSWLNLIRIHDLKEQFFREYYRSGNVYLYQLDANVMPKTITNFGLTSHAAKEKVPVKYILLNPSDIKVADQLAFGSFAYTKTLTPFEIARLKHREDDPEAQKIYDGLSEKVRKQIESYNAVNTLNQEILLDLDVELFHPVFYKKQDYEPLAVPLGFSVLDDLNKKAELKKIDQAMARSIENVILLITMGAEPDKGGINHKNVAAMRELLESNSVGRAIVSDYTTKGEFLQPDLKKVMGKEKYEVLNKDIQEGLGNILLGESKYSDTELKVQIFFDRLEDSRSRFLKDFLQPEINKVCRKMGFREVPKAVFNKKETIAKESSQRLIARMMELGVLTPEQGMETINKGHFPKAEEMEASQKKYLKAREKGYYVPVVGGQVLIKEDEGEDTEDVEAISMNKISNNEKRTSGKDQKKSATVSAPSGGRPMGAVSYSNSALMEVVESAKGLESVAKEIYKKELGIKRFNKEKKKLITDLCSAVIINSDATNWEQDLEEVILNNSKLLSLSTHPSVLSLAAEHQLDDYAAALLYHSTKIDNVK
jgi:hypothetical protein